MIHRYIRDEPTSNPKEMFLPFGPLVILRREGLPPDEALVIDPETGRRIAWLTGLGAEAGA